MDYKKTIAELSALTLPALPYARDALAPVISSRTIDFHYDQHHKNYVNKLNALIADTDLANLTLPEIITNTYDQASTTAIFNNAAQAWNHTFYWHSLKPSGGGSPAYGLKNKIDQDFGDIDNLKKNLVTTAVETFGSGWVWLVVADQQLKVVSTTNANLPMTHGWYPLLNIDIWEHAYYLDYQHQRIEYAKALVDWLLNWEFAENNYRAFAENIGELHFLSLADKQLNA